MTGISSIPASIASTLSSRRQSVASSDTSINDAEGDKDVVPPSEVVQAELAQARAIPKTFMSSMSAWWNTSENTSKDAETRLLKRLPFFRTEHEPDVEPTEENPNPITARVTQVPLVSNTKTAKGGRSINTVSFLTPETKGAKEAVVLTHGYGAGLAFFYRNWKDLAESSASVGRSAYAIDWLGMGRSSRPDPKELVSSRNATPKERVEKAEMFFLESLDEWREKMGIEKMVLIGHSLGGYITTAYALRYPERVDRLILLSPAGIPDHPEKGPDIPDGEVLEAAAKELTEPQTETADAPRNSKPSMPKRPTYRSAPPTELTVSGTETERAAYSRQNSTASVDSNERFAEDKEAKKGNQGLWKKAVYYMWEEGVSPFGLVRKLGPMGPMLVARYSTRRFGALPEEDIKDLHEYIWSLTKARGSSEYAITHLLAPGAHARWPLVKRVAKLKIPVCYSYGDHDWMDIQGGYDAVEAMRKAGNRHGKVIQIKHAGHHLYMDNAERTNAMIRSEILAAAKRSKVLASMETGI